MERRNRDSIVVARADLGLFAGIDDCEWTIVRLGAELMWGVSLRVYWRNRWRGSSI